MFRVNIDNLQQCGFANAQVCARRATSRRPSTASCIPTSRCRPRERRCARRQAEGAEAARDHARPDHDARPERDDDRRARARHLVQARASRLPHRAAAGDGHGRTRRRRRTTSNYVYYDSVQANAKAAAQQLKAAMGPNTNVAPLPPRLATYAQQAGNPLAIVARRHGVRRRDRQPAGARRPGAAAPAAQRAQRSRRDARHRAAGQGEGAVPDHGAARDRAKLEAEHARARSRLQAGAAHARARADVRHGRGQRLLGRDRDELDGRADPPHETARTGSPAASTTSSRPAATST